MDKKISISNKPDNPIVTNIDNELGKITDDILLDTRTDITKVKSFSVPIAQLSVLGAAAASLIPPLRTVTQTAAINTHGLFQLANACTGDVLKVAKNGNFWGAFKTAQGKSKFVQLKAADPISATSSTVMPINPAIMLMAVALFSVEQKLDNIADMQKQIISFLEIEKQSEIEADVETLSNIIAKYKHNWDNENFVRSNHKMVLDIQRNMRKNMLFYQSKISELLQSKKLITTRTKVSSTLNDILKKFKYYRLTLYAYALSSLIEVLLSGNFKEENISVVVSELEQLSLKYRELFMECSIYLEDISKVSVESNALKGIGTASKAVGKLIGSIPIVKEGPVDEFLQDNGAHLQKNALGMEREAILSFAALGNPEISVFIEKMKDLIEIYNHTSKICFDNKRIYLVA